ncbi:hypothetical protein [Pseudaestuariivita sp.]|uniref:hypothetical protein n=1 Tax=Pseudaestuariivita sp. TaxID=2211669 RepID=UPI004057D28E
MTPFMAFGGDDTLKGGIGSDLFVFRGNAGNDVIVDFDASRDSLLLENTRITSVTQDAVGTRLTF